MARLLSKCHLALSWLTVAAIFAQFFLSGLGIFHAAGFTLHRAVGYGVVFASLLLLLLAGAGRMGRLRLALSALLVGLAFAQSLLPKGPPLVAALHPLNALAVLGCAVALARAGMAAESIERSVTETRRTLPKREGDEALWR